MSTQLSAADVIAIDINGHTITIVPSQQFITCNIEQALGWQWNACLGLVGWRWVAIDGVTHSFFSFKQIQYMAEKLNKQIPTILHKYIYPLTRHDDKENQIMTTNQLINLYEQKSNNGLVQTVEAREIHKFLESKREFAHWVKDRIEQFDFIENEDFVRVDNFVKRGHNSNLGTKTKDYYFTLSAAKELAMVENNAKGKEARKYFIECEKKAQNPQIEHKPEPVKVIRHTNASAMRAADRMIEKMTISDDRKTLARAYLLHKEYDIPVETMLPAVAHKLNATEIGKQLGISANMVGRITNELGIKNDSALCELRLDKSPHSSKQIETCYYAPSVIDMVKAKLNERKAS